MAEGYVARLPARIAPRAVSTPGATGRAIAEGLSGLAATGARIAALDAKVDEQLTEDEARIAEIEKRSADGVLTAQVGIALEEVDGAWQGEKDKLPEYGNSGALGYAAAARALIEERAAKLEAMVADNPDVASHVLPQIARWRVRETVRADAYERAETLKMQGHALELKQQGNANRVMAGTMTIPEAMADLDAFTAAMGLPGNASVEVDRANARTIYDAQMERWTIDRNEPAMRQALESGHLDDVFTPDEKASWLKRADAIAEVNAREAAVAESEARLAAKEEIKAIDALIEAGETVPQSRMQAALAAAKGAGVPDSELIPYAASFADVDRTRRFQGMATPVLEEQLAPLRAARDAGQLDDKGLRLLEAGERVLGTRTRKDAEKLGPMLKGPPESRLQGLAQLRAMPLAERWRAAQEAGDTKAAVLAGLPARQQALAVQGAALRKAREADFLPAKEGTVRDPKAEVDRLFRAELGHLVADAGGAYGDLREAALDYMAGNVEGWNAAAFARAVQVIYGANTRADGKRQGGIGTLHGRKVELPTRWTEAEFATFIARLPMPGAVYADKSPARAEDVKRNYRLRHDGTGEDGTEFYLFVSPDGAPLKYRNGQNWRLPVPRTLPGSR